MRLFSSNSKISNLPPTFISTTQPLPLSEDVLLKSKSHHNNYNSPLSVRDNLLATSASSKSIDAINSEKRIQRLLEKNQNECTSKERRILRRYKSRLASVKITNLISDQMKPVNVLGNIDNKMNNKCDNNISLNGSDIEDVKQHKKLIESYNKHKEQTLIGRDRKSFLREFLMLEEYSADVESYLKKNSDTIMCDNMFVEDNNNKKNNNQTSQEPNQSPYKLIENSVQITKGYTQVNNFKFNRMKKKKDLSVLPLLEQNRRLEQRKLQILAKKKRQNNTMEHLHPLNSERRRANRRKPSLKQKIIHRLSGKKKHNKGLQIYKRSGYFKRHKNKEKQQDV